MSANKAGMSRNTARKQLRQNDPLQQDRKPHTWRTRQDPLEASWPEDFKMLREAPELEPRAQFHYATTQGVKESGLPWEVHEQVEKQMAESWLFGKNWC